jgi:hypothetical protein
MLLFNKAINVNCFASVTPARTGHFLNHLKMNLILIKIELKKKMFLI